MTANHPEFTSQSAPSRLPKPHLSPEMPAMNSAYWGGNGEGNLAATTVVGTFRTLQHARESLIELRERFLPDDIAVVVRYRGEPVPVPSDSAAAKRDAEFWDSPTCVFVRAGGRAGEISTYFNFCDALRVETRNPAARATPM